ncbi:MAG: DUF6173 family protein [Dissulfurispiraceae bacterium]
MSENNLIPKLNYGLPKIEIPLTESPQLVINAEQGMASAFYERLAKWINNFDSSLDEEHEVGVRLVSFGQTILFHLKGMGYWNPFLISFSGTTDDGDPVELIQHVNQISILLMKLPRKDPEKPKRPIGFNTEIDKKE